MLESKLLVMKEAGQEFAINHLGHQFSYEVVYMCICKYILRFICIGALILNTSAYAAVDIDLPSEQRIPIRQNIRECQTFLLNGDQKIDDSVGVPFGSNNVEEFRQELAEAIQTYGLERFRNATFYVVGIAMKNSSAVQQEFNAVVVESGLASVDGRVIVLSVPTHLVKEEATQLARKALERTVYFLPSLKRDLQSPQFGELISAFSTSAMQEIPNMVLLFDRIPAVDATLAVTSHAVILSSMLIYEKSLINWLLRSGSKTEQGRRLEMFFKNMLVSMPYILSYNIFGQFSKILDFYAAHGFGKMAQAFPAEVANFASTQGLTMVLQALFFSQVINSGISAWVNGQVGEQNTRDARTLRPWIEYPILSLDAALLGWAASGQADILFSLGPMSVNSGHVALAAITATGAGVFALAPNVLNPTLNWYRKAKEFLARLRAKDK